MRKVTKIGDIDLDYPLFVKEEFNNKYSQGSAYNTLGGGLVIFERVKRASGEYRTLISKDSGWISEDTLNKLLNILDDIEVEITITYDNNDTEKVRPALEKGQIIKHTDAVNENGGWFKVEINLCRI